MVSESRAAGRPRSFDERVIVEQAVTTFWKHGRTNTTMRILESELGLMPASIYNAFGSKQDLLERALESYLDQVAAELLVSLDEPESGVDELIDFVDRLVVWVTDSNHPGCMMLNLLAEQSPGDDSLAGYARLHRARMRTAFLPPLTRMDAAHAPGRAELLVVSALGISAAAQGGASRSEMGSLALAVKDQIRRWSDG
ncbi:MAG: TetR/AcrR family transcriptional regulator [Acidimicrobiales bacterium]